MHSISGYFWSGFHSSEKLRKKLTVDWFINWLFDWLFLELLLLFNIMEFKSINDLQKWFFKNKGSIVNFILIFQIICILLWNTTSKGWLTVFVTKLKRNVHFANCSPLLKKKRRMVWKDYSYFSTIWKCWQKLPMKFFPF